MLESRSCVMLGNVKCDWPILAGFPLLWCWRKTYFPKDKPDPRQVNDIVRPQNWKHPWIKPCDEIILIFFLSQVWFSVASPKIQTKACLYCLTLGKQLSISKPQFFPCRMRRVTECSETLPFASASYMLRTRGSPWEAHCEWPECVDLKGMTQVHNFYKCRIIYIVKHNIF